MLPQEIIRQKRHGEELSPEILSAFIRDFMQGSVSDYQMSAFLMATYFKGMSLAETLALTEAFVQSGERIDLSSISGIKVDKHSSGGVGDKISLLLVPIVSAAGVCVPMISGRGLGHTGGTLDKLEAIPGFNTRLSTTEFITQMQKIGAAMIGQTERMVPADKKIYAIRDVSATVEIPPFIVASILSKKIAEGTNALVLDVKSGNGAFMDSDEKSMELAEQLVTVGEHFGLAVSGIISDMNEPLGYAIGNWLEVVETVDCLNGIQVDDVLEVTFALAGLMIHQAKKSSSIVEGMLIAQEIVRNGLALEKLREIVEAQGGKSHFIENTLAYPNPKAMLEIHAEDSGYIHAIDARALGLLSIELGAGRKLITDVIDPVAGIILKKKIGDRVESGEALCMLCTSTSDHLFQLKSKAQAAFKIVDSPRERRKRVRMYFDKTGFYPWQEIVSSERFAPKP